MVSNASSQLASHQGLASAWVQQFLDLIPRDTGPVLDLACGGGRHTRLLLDAGFEVWAIDRNADLLAPLAAIGAKCFVVDLEHETRDGVCVDGLTWPFQSKTFAGIVVTNYLYRPLMPFILAALNDNGILIYETFALGNARYGRPKNPDFLLHDNELLAHFVNAQSATYSQQCIAYEHGYVKQPQEAIVQRICVRRLFREL
jgi:SAM-dependent methyltransferase